MLRRVAPAAAFGGLILFAFMAQLLAETRTVEKPMFNGNRLGWCANWGADCGEPAAQAWCIAQGFAGTANFVKAPKIGDKFPTRLIGTGAICDSAECDGFKEITCVKLDAVQPATVEASAEPAQADPPATMASEVEESQPAAAESEASPLPVPDAEATMAAAPEAQLEAQLEAEPVAESEGDIEAAVRVVTPDSADTEPMATDETPVQAVAVMTMDDADDDDDGPPPPEAWMLAAAGAPPIKPLIEVFQSPVFDGRRLDWCRGWKDKCGKATADEFCRLNGFIEAASFLPDPNIGANEPTRQIASGLVCDHEGCDGFAEIACRK